MRIGLKFVQAPSNVDSASGWRHQIFEWIETMKRFNNQLILCGITGAALLASGCSGGQEGSGPATSVPSVPDSVKEKLSEAKETVAENADKAKEVVAESAEKAKDAVAAGVAKAREAIESIELPKLPEVDSFKSDFSKMMGSVSETLSSVKDSATADAAAAKLKELSAKLDPVKEALAKVPAAAKELVNKYVVANAVYLKEQAAQLYVDSGVKAKLQPIIDEIVAKLEALTK